MIHGATIRRASTAHTSPETATIATTQTPVGAARTRLTAFASVLTAKADLAQPHGELVRVVEPDVRSRPRELAEDGIAHGLASRRQLDRLRVPVGRALEVVLARDVARRSLPEDETRLRAR